MQLKRFPGYASLLELTLDEVKRLTDGEVLFDGRMDDPTGIGVCVARDGCALGIVNTSQQPPLSVPVTLQLTVKVVTQ